MKNRVICNGKVIEYNLTRKNVRNINLRIKPDGTVHVSANRSVSPKVIDIFLASKADFITKALEKYENTADVPQKLYFPEDEICDVITALCENVYPYFKMKGIKYPQIKFRKMVSRWGSCHTVKGVLTFNINLMYAPIECIEYVVLHEFTHFLQPNHSSRFYDELEKVCPDWKACREKLKQIRLR